VEDWKNCPFNKDIERLDHTIQRVESKVDGLGSKVDDLRLSQAQAQAGASTSKVWWDAIKFVVTIAISVFAAMGVLAARTPVAHK
jgi:hypothetical protein